MRFRKLKVGVEPYDGRVIVRLTRSHWNTKSAAAHVANIDLMADDADDKIAEARSRAKDLAAQLNALER